MATDHQKSAFLRRFYLKLAKVICAEANAVRFSTIHGHFIAGGLGRQAVIVDLGAHKGGFSRWIVRKHGTFSRLIIVEPDPALVKELRAQFGGDRRIEIVDTAVSGTSNASAEFYFSKNREASSLHRDIAGSFGMDDQRQALQMRTITLEGIFRAYGLEKIHLLKMDVEGSEYEILDNLGDEDFKRIDQISVEFHDFVNPALRSKTEGSIERLKALGYAFVHEAQEYKNCLFYRNSLRLRIRGTARIVLLFPYLLARLFIRFLGKLSRPPVHS